MTNIYRKLPNHLKGRSKNKTQFCYFFFFFFFLAAKTAAKNLAEFPKYLDTITERTKIIRHLA